MLDGRELTAVEIQKEIHLAVARFVDAGRCDDELVPGMRELVLQWGWTLEELGREEFSRLTPKLDWLLKLSFLQRAGCLDGGGKARYLDQIYHSLDPREGLYFKAEAAGLTHRLATEDQIHRALSVPPDNTRAFGRAMLLSLSDPTEVAGVDWDEIEFHGDPKRAVHMGDPRAWTRVEMRRFMEEDGVEGLIDGLARPVANGATTTSVNLRVNGTNHSQ